MITNSATKPRKNPTGQLEPAYEDIKQTVQILYKKESGKTELSQARKLLYEWLINISDKKSPRTLYMYKCHVGKFLDYTHDQKPPVKVLSYTEGSKEKESLQETLRAYATQKTPSNSTIHTRLDIVHAYYAYLHSTGVVPSIPTVKVEYRKEKEASPVSAYALMASQVKLLETCLKNPQYALRDARTLALLAILTSTGILSRELPFLMLEDVTFFYDKNGDVARATIPLSEKQSAFHVARVETLPRFCATTLYYYLTLSLQGDVDTYRKKHADESTRYPLFSQLSQNTRRYVEAGEKTNEKALFVAGMFQRIHDDALGEEIVRRVTANTYYDSILQRDQNEIITVTETQSIVNQPIRSRAILRILHDQLGAAKLRKLVG